MRKIILLIAVLGLMSLAPSCNPANPQSAPPVPESLAPTPVATADAGKTDSNDVPSDALEKPADSQSEMSSFTPTGTVLAGSTSPFVEFNTADYEQAIAEGRPILLTFHAEWCPVCQTELVSTKEAFNELENSNLVGFHVDYKDGNTDDSEKDLAKEFNVIFQHTKVIMKDGQVLEKTFEEWQKEDFITSLAGLV